MKTCPQCQTSYTDDSLQYCLQDGTPLVAANPSQAGNWGESETLVSPRQADQARFDVPTRQQQTYGNYAGGATGSNLNQNTAAVEQPRNSRTGLIVAVSVLLTLLVAGAGLGAYLLFRKPQNDVVLNVNTKPPININTPNAAQSSNTNQPNINVNQNVNQATPTPKPTLNPKQVDEIKSNVENVIDDWKDASENHDLEAHLSNYAPTVDYYKAGSANIEKIRADKQRAFDAYNDINISIDNLKITPDATGEKATAVFDKEWKFENEEKTSTGKVQQQLQLAKINGKWRITGEKDIKVYYVDK